ncbi:MAG: protein kinase [Gemmatimonadota bacterium]|nr:MAG: protein kinase [Gemmatimonadota bacterium]
MSVCIHCSTPLPDGSQFCSQCGTPVPGRGPDSPTLTPQGREIFDRLKEATAGRYEVLRELGRGGMAVVFLGYQKSLDRYVAIKVLLPLLGYDPEIVERFTREARTQGKLDHPNIIQVFEIYNEGGLTFFTVPYISGRSLRVFLQDNPHPTIEKIRRYLGQAADALAYAHRRGVVHRDVKPDNILIDADRDRVILTDFGIAKALAAETTLTTPGDLLGTPQYMSPEQGEGRHDLDGRADQYSLGLIGYEMLAGRRALQADNLAELMYKHRFEDPPPIHQIRPDAPRNLLDVVTRAISKDRDERFPTMEAFLAALETPDFLSAVDEDRTEPMPSLDGEEATLRVHTPPGVMRTPRPGGIDSTTPETTEPPGRPPVEADLATAPTITPAPTVTPPPATPPPRTPPPATPQPAVTTPTGAPRPDVAATPTPVSPARATPRPQPPRPARPEPARVGADRRRGAPRGLLLGSGAVIALVLAGLYFFGPLKPGGAGDTADDGAAGAEELGSEVIELPPVESPSQVAEGSEQTPTAAEDAAATPADAGPGEPVAAGGPPADAGESEGVRRARQQAEGARDRALNERRAALNAGVPAGALSALDARRNTATGQLQAGRYDEAAQGFSSLIVDYRNLRVAADGAGRARQSAGSQQQAAVAAGAASVLESDLRDLDARLARAETAYNEFRYADAQTLFQELSDDYEQLAQRATREYRSRATEAKTAMERQRQAALNQGAQEREPQRLAQADGLRSTGLTREGAGAYPEAIARFGEAQTAYQRLAADLAARPAAAAEEPPAAPATPTVSAAEAISNLIERFRQAFEQEDLARMAAEVYKGPVPEGRNNRSDGQWLSTIFSAAEVLTAEARYREPQPGATAATVDIDLQVNFRQQRTGQTRDMTRKLRLDFVLEAGEWRLRSLQER